MDNLVDLNQSILIPYNNNSVVHITNLPVNIDYGTLFRALRGTGKINRANIAGREAFVHFWGLDGVVRLLEKSRDGLFIIGTQRPFVKIAVDSPERPLVSDQLSRVLIISGPKEIINYENLSILFSEKFTFNVESIEISDEELGYQTMRWSFASYTQQSLLACRTIKEERQKALRTSRNFYSPWKFVWFRYDSDPCQAYQTLVLPPHRASLPIHPLPSPGQLSYEDYQPLPSSSSRNHDSTTLNEDEEENENKPTDESLSQNMSSASFNSDPEQHYRKTTGGVSLPSHTPPRIGEFFQGRRRSF
ncbi:hypothetical protein F5Y00DRAFT_273579 [Daldinia vernicosa]|uniref:uncharacterized protein n=1 Tax=Daldinia vernicosa TaxID=114800 RepID=UPI00200796F5|nr:uncharacterized protein F5Y00DRAFT_273579 [Daldinia vernicosa]KAI0844739.1 hypothetical protein F5Y00DRAFT_273579 [Daldinia vernicosa]